MTRRVAGSAISGLIPVILWPGVASAKYRPSLAESKGWGSSPVVDSANEPQAVSTLLSKAGVGMDAIRGAFAKFDTDGNGKLSAAEFKTVGLRLC